MKADTLAVIFMSVSDIYSSTWNIRKYAKWMNERMDTAY